MTQEISQQLRDKLKIIEIETEFFSRKPEKPQRRQYIVGAMVLLILSGMLSALTSEDYFQLAAFLGIAGINFLTIFYEKQLFELYTSACEIINYYKKDDEGKL